MCTTAPGARLRAERSRALDRGPVQRAAVAGRARVDAAQVDRSERQARPARLHHQDGARPDEEAQAGSVVAGARREAGPGGGTRQAAAALMSEALRLAVGDATVSGLLDRPADARGVHVCA